MRFAAPTIHRVSLPLQPPIEPMLSRATDEIPQGEGWSYEPKWDGFRAIVFRDGDDLYVQSRNEQPLARYFPELVDRLLRALPKRCVVDGEIIVPGPKGLDFDALQQRLHPAASRVAKLAKETPASFVAFDLLAFGAASLLEKPFETRRARLVKELAPGSTEEVFVTPSTRSVKDARTWFERFEGAGLDGVIAKPLDGKYRPGERVMVKIKHERTADVVVAGYRHHKSGPVVGSLMLGLYGADGVLNYVGGSSAFTMARRAALIDELAPLRLEEGAPHPWLDEEGDEPDETHRRPGAQHRWNAGKDTSFIPLRPELVCEVNYDQLQADRFRHNARFVRWRPDRDPLSCRYDQLDVPAPYDFADVID